MVLFSCLTFCDVVYVSVITLVLLTCVFAIRAVFTATFTVLTVIIG